MMKVADLAGAQLDYWTARAEGIPADTLIFYTGAFHGEEICARQDGGFPVPLRYSADWNQGGPIIERERITIHCAEAGRWGAWIKNPDPSAWAHKGDGEGEAPLIAAMRAYVASKFGDEVREKD